MKNKLFTVLAVALTLALAGCSDEDPDAGVKDLTSYYKLEGGLEGCSISKVISKKKRKKKYANLYVAHCEGKSVTTTTYASGKTNTTVITINGVEYEATPKKKKE